MSKNGWIPLNAHIVASAAVVGNREKQGLKEWLFR